MSSPAAPAYPRHMENDSLYTGELKAEATELRFATYNVDQAMREEAHDYSKWNVREDRVRALIRKIDAHIITLQEMRSLPDATHTVNQFLGTFTQYRYAIAYRNASSLSFGQATLYDPKHYYMLRTETRWLSDDPTVLSDTFSTTAHGSTGFGTIVLATQFVAVRNGCVVRGAAPFWVFNVHFALAEDVKTKSCGALLRIVEELAGSGDGAQHVIIAGDFNFFPDRDGSHQRAILTEVLHDAAKGALTSQQQRAIEGTFVGYEHDAFHGPIPSPTSRLDHVFISRTGITVQGSATLHTETMLESGEPDELTERNSLPSDHLPISMHLSVPGCARRLARWDAAGGTADALGARAQC